MPGYGRKNNNPTNKPTNELIKKRTLKKNKKNKKNEKLGFITFEKQILKLKAKKSNKKKSKKRAKKGGGFCGYNKKFSNK